MNTHYAYSRCRAHWGMTCPEVKVEVSQMKGLPQFKLVGLPDASLKESRDRVKSAILRSGFAFPNKALLVNLSPSTFPKDGTHYDLAIALALLASDQQIPTEALEHHTFLGELTLSGTLLPVPGVLNVARALAEQGQQTLVCHPQSAAAAVCVPGLRVLSADHLSQVGGYLLGHHTLSEAQAPPIKPAENLASIDDIVGQSMAKWAMTVAAAGSHHILLVGSPGCGKSMLAKRLNTLLPPLTPEENLDCQCIQSLLPHRAQVPWGQRPFVHHHHHMTAAALVGGGMPPTPGAVTMAHHGVLFLDEMAEMSSSVLDQLREPMENLSVRIARQGYVTEFPCHFQLVAAMNPTDRGPVTDMSRISQPMLDRFDLLVEMASPSSWRTAQAHDATTESWSHEQALAAVKRARARQRRAGRINGRMTHAMIEQHCRLTAEAEAHLDHVWMRAEISMRGVDLWLKVSQTLCDIDGSDVIDLHHLEQAAQFRELAADGTRFLTQPRYQVAKSPA